MRGIDSTGALGAQSTYSPYGNGGPTSGDDMRYTGQQQEPSSSLGLYYYKARFYSPVLGTFVSADSVTKDGLNRYQYARGNPVAFTDPTGNCVGGLPCTPSSALNIAACASGIDACYSVFSAMGLGKDLELIQAAVRFAEAAVQTNDFWLNYMANDPFARLPELAAPYSRGNPFAPSFADVLIGAQRAENSRFGSAFDHWAGALWNWASDPYRVTATLQAGAGASVGLTCGAALATGGALSGACLVSGAVYGVTFSVKLYMDMTKVNAGKEDLGTMMIQTFRGAVWPLLPRLSPQQQMAVQVGFWMLERGVEHLNDVGGG